MSSNMDSMLNWVQPEPGKCYYELREGDRIWATLEWKNTRNKDAEGMSGDRRLTLKQRGFFFRETAIADAETGSEIAAFKFYGGDKGELKFRDGYKVRWKFEGLLEPRWYLTTEKGSRLLCFSIPPAKKSTGARIIAVVEVLREMDDKSLSLLAIIGWYNLYTILSTGL